MTTGAPPHDTAAPAALVAGTSRRLPLRSCCYQVVMSYNMWCPPHYMGGLSYYCLTRTLLYLSTPNTTRSPNVTYLTRTNIRHKHNKLHLGEYCPPP
jgi:ribosomal protein L33